MKVIFNDISKELLTLATDAMRNLVTAMNADRKPDGTQTSLDPNQRIIIIGENLAIVGNRYALMRGELRGLINAIAEEGLVPDVYETTEPRLVWNETPVMYFVKCYATLGKHAQEVFISEQFAKNPRGPFNKYAKLIADRVENCRPGTKEYLRAVAGGSQPSETALGIFKMVKAFEVSSSRS